MKYLLKGSGDKPADLLLPSHSAGRGLAIDVTVSNPLKYSGTLSAAEHAADLKRQKYKERCAEQGIDFIAFSVNTPLRSS